MSRITESQLRFAAKLLEPHGSGYAEWVHNASRGRTTELSQLRKHEAHALIQALQQDWNPNKLKADVKRKKIYSFCHTLGWHIQPGVVDAARLDAWCIQYGQHHKPLQDHSLRELDDLLTQFGQVFKKELKKR
jgi:DNA polymerase I-like protein with 3'-5' exonuclease and polymerase domains